MKSVTRGLWVLVAAGAAGYVGLTVWLALRAMFFPYTLDYGEGDVFWFTLKLARGLNIYETLGGPPFDAANYPPVAMLLTAAMAPVFGEALTFGRWLNFAAALVVAAFAVRLVRTETRDWRVALLMGLLFLGSTFVYHWMPLYRVDLIGLAFTLGGIFWVRKWEDGGRGTGDGGREAVPLVTERRRKREAGALAYERRRRQGAENRRGATWELALAGCFFLLALYTKHSLVFGPLAAVGAIFLRERRTGIFFAAALGGIGGAIFLLLDILTRGGWSFGIITANATVWTPSVFVPLMQSFLATYAVLLGLAAWGWWTRVRGRHFGILEIYAAATLASLALAGREGAWENYFLEAIVMACVFAGLAIAPVLRFGQVSLMLSSSGALKANRFPANLRESTRRGTRKISENPRRFAEGKGFFGGQVLVWGLPVLLLAQLALFWNDHDPQIAGKLFEEVRAGNERVGALVRETEGTVIAEDMGLLWGNGKPVEYYSFVYSTLARAGRYDQKWETENLRAGNFPLVILNQGTREDVDQLGNFTHAFVAALDYGYRVASQDARYVVYEPAPLEHSGPRAIFGGMFELVGWTREPDTPEGGKELRLTMVWRALEKAKARYTTFAHLEEVGGGKLAQDDHEPLGGKYPTTRWAQGEMVRETYRLTLPPNIAAGDYVLRVGWYDTATQDRLSMGDGGDILDVEKFTVK